MYAYTDVATSCSRGWTGGPIETVLLQFRSLVLDPLVVQDEVICDGQLVMRVPTQQGTVHLTLGHRQFLRSENNVD